MKTQVDKQIDDLRIKVAEGGGSDGVGEKVPESPNQSAERFNDYREYTIDGENSTGGNFATGLNDHVEGYGNHGIGGSNNHYAGSGNYGYNCTGLDIGGYTNKARNCNSTIVRGIGNDINSAEMSAFFGNGLYVGGATNVLALGAGTIAGQIRDSLFIQSTGGQATGNIAGAISIGDMNKVLGNCGQLAVFGGSNTVTNATYAMVAGIGNTLTGRSGILLGYGGVIDDENPYVFAVGRSAGLGNGFAMDSSGNVYALGSYNTMGADYAEYFEWVEKSEENRKRRGYLVEFCGDKIIPAHGNDFIGVISANPSIVGNACELHWHGKYLLDEFGEVILDEAGKPIISPEYDPKKKYIPRSKRPEEWAAVGLLGRLVIVDDGSCKPGGFVSARYGIGTKCYAKTNAKVLRRINENHCEVLVGGR